MCLVYACVFRYSVQLVETVIKHLFLHPSPTPAFSALSMHLHAELTLLATARGQQATHLLQLMLRMLPLQPTTTTEQMLSAASVITRLLPLTLAFASSNAESE